MPKKKYTFINLFAGIKKQTICLPKDYLFNLDFIEQFGIRV